MALAGQHPAQWSSLLWGQSHRTNMGPHCCTLLLQVSSPDPFSFSPVVGTRQSLCAQLFSTTDSTSSCTPHPHPMPGPVTPPSSKVFFYGKGQTAQCTGCSCREPMFNSPHPHGGSQLSIAQFQITPSSDLGRLQACTQCMDKKHS